MGKNRAAPRITIEGISYNYTQICEDPISPQTGYGKNIVKFCRAWMREEQKFVMMTSGSTGDQKEIVLTRNQMIKSAKKLGTLLHFQPGQTVLMGLDNQYIAGQMMLVRSFVFGMHVYATKPCSNPLENLPENMPVHTASFVPYQVRTMLNSPDSRNKLETINNMLIGGSPIPASLKNAISRLSCEVYATYGMTETCAAIALQKMNGHDQQDAFHALPGIVLSQNASDCLVVHSDFLPHKITTRDIVRMTGKNQFQWLGRLDNLINSGGVKVMPEKMEEKIQNIFTTLGVMNDFFIAGMPDNRLGQRVSLVMEGKAPELSTQQMIIQKIKSETGLHQAPKEIQFMARFIKTQSGKVDRIKTLAQIRM